MFIKSWSNRAAADAVALALTNTDEDGWTYTVMSLGVAWIIVTRDEYGNTLGAL